MDGYIKYSLGHPRWPVVDIVDVNMTTLIVSGKRKDLSIHCTKK